MLSQLDKDVGFLENALRLRSQRQQVLASNIANADTPNYKAKDLDFAKSLQSAMQGTQNDGGLKTTHVNHLGALGSGTGGSSGSVAVIKPRESEQNSADKNTVDLDTEVTAFTDNALQYETLIGMINGQFKNINVVLQQG